jgi:hypothetical protein
MKTRYNSKEIAHAWAHQLSPRGTAPSAMSFEGPVFYSYGTAVARLVERNGKQAAIFNDAGFSSTTSKHQGMVACALPSDLLVMHACEGRGTSLNVKPAALFEYAITKSAECLGKAEKARKNGDYLKGQAGEWLERARQVSDFYGLRRKVDEKAVSRLSAARQWEEKRKIAKAEKDAAERRERRLADFAAWKAGETVHSDLSDFPVAFRVEGPELVSSMGARVPVKDAKRALRFVLKHKGQEWRENGGTCPVGGYRVQAIAATGVIAGCHRIAWDEVEHVKELLS